MKEKKRILYVCGESELAISLASVPKELSPYGFAIETDGNGFFLSFWTGQGDNQRFLDPIQLHRGMRDDFLLHPRAKSEIIKLLNREEKEPSKDPQSLLEVLMSVTEVE